MGIPPTIIGKSFFCVRSGILCGLHVKTAAVIVVSVTQEPLRIALGTFHTTQIAALSASSTAHVGSIVSALGRAFESGTGIEVVEPGILDLGCEMPTEAQVPAARALRVQFTVFSTSYDVTLSLKPCPVSAKEPFAWFLVMELFSRLQRDRSECPIAAAARDVINPVVPPTRVSKNPAPRPRRSTRCDSSSEAAVHSTSLGLTVSSFKVRRDADRERLADVAQKASSETSC